VELINITVSWIAATCYLVDRWESFAGAGCLHLQCSLIREDEGNELNCDVGIQSDSEGKINIVGDDSIGHCEEREVSMKMCLILNGCLYRSV
jgi:hypothetical protein